MRQPAFLFFFLLSFNRNLLCQDSSHICNHIAGTSGRTDLFCILPFIFVRALNHDIIGTFMDMNHSLGTGSDTHPAGNALLLIHLGRSVFIHGDRTEFADGGTITAADTSICTSVPALRRTASVTRHNRRTVWESFLSCHNYPFLSYGVPVIGRLNLLSPSSL